MPVLPGPGKTSILFGLSTHLPSSPHSYTLAPEHSKTILPVTFLATINLLVTILVLRQFKFTRRQSKLTVSIL